MRFHRRSNKMTIPLAVVAGMVPLAIGTWQHGQFNGWTGSGDTAMDYFVRSLTGFSPNAAGYGGSTFNIRNMKHGALPIVVGMIAHKVAGRIGINGALARAGIPFIRI